MIYIVCTQFANQSNFCKSFSDCHCHDTESLVRTKIFFPNTWHVGGTTF